MRFSFFFFHLNIKLCYEAPVLLLRWRRVNTFPALNFGIPLRTILLNQNVTGYGNSLASIKLPSNISNKAFKTSIFVYN